MQLLVVGLSTMWWLYVPTTIQVLKCPYKSKPEENKDKVHLHYSNSVDSWAVGVLVYELLVGCPPFFDRVKSATEARIANATPFFPPTLSEGARSFITAGEPCQNGLDWHHCNSMACPCGTPVNQHISLSVAERQGVATTIDLRWGGSSNLHNPRFSQGTLLQL